MPLYEYQCETCGHRFERIQKFSDPPAGTCPLCGGPVTKLLSSPAIHFKGSGWYITDYARKGDGSGKTEGRTDGKTEGKAEGKPEGTADAKTGGDSKSSKGSGDSGSTGSSSSDSKAADGGPAKSS
jgi:putative FmdB family regulatory protein